MTLPDLSAPTKRAYLLEARRLRNNFMPGEGGQEGGKDDGGGKRGRGKAITFPELMCYMWSALGTNERFSAGAPTAVRLSSFNTAYTQRVKWMKVKWRGK